MVMAIILFVADPQLLKPFNGTAANVLQMEVNLLRSLLYFRNK